MDSGIDFLRGQINNAVMQHGTFLQSLVDHESQAEDGRFRDLCARHIPRVREHQRMLEQYQQQLSSAPGGDGGHVLGDVGGAVKQAIGTAMGMAKDLADAPRQSDFLRLVADIVMSRQAEDTFKTFREAGRTLGIQRLGEIGDVCERHHDEYNREANRLAQQMFIEHARGAEHAVEVTRASAQPSSLL